MGSKSLGDAITRRGVRVLDNVRDVDAAREQIARAGVRPIGIVPLERDAPINAQMTATSPTEDVTIARVSFGRAVAITPSEPEEGAYVFASAVAGLAELADGTARARFTPGAAGFVSPTREFLTRASATYDCAFVAFPQHRVDPIVEELLDGAPPSHLEFDYSRDVTFPRDDVYTLLQTIVELGDRDAVLRDRRVHSRLIDLVLETLLLHTPSFRDLFDSRGGIDNQAVRKAMDFMLAHLSEPLRLADIAVATRVSPRTLQLAFNREVGQSPMRWLRVQRLEHADRMLRSPHFDHRQITDIAHDSGFHHMSDFAARFHQHFGVRPSERRRHDRDRARDSAHRVAPE